LPSREPVLVLGPPPELEPARVPVLGPELVRPSPEPALEPDQA
jgi:hypothetical protein